MSTKLRLLEQQRRWANSAGLDVDGRGYVSSRDTNPFQQMSSRTELAFKGGGGSELLGRESAPPKIQALHSSAALAVNVFDYWAVRDLALVTAALGLREQFAHLEFEKQFPTGLGGTPPNIDLVLTDDSGQLVGVESKFREWLAPKPPGKQHFKEKYFQKGADRVGRWACLALPNCQALAEDLNAGEVHFRYLDAAQLLKHALGMASACPGRFALYYLYFDLPGKEAAVHAAEVAEFEKRGGIEVAFQSATYQTVFERFSQIAAPYHHAYLGYLRGRYFAPVC
jgi:hypothetical protein